MASAPYSFPYPSAATYPPPPFPGGYYYPSPFPYASSSDPSPPAPGFFPAPAHGPSTFVPLPPAPPPAYPYPPSASAYMAATGFSAVPAYGPSTLPSTIHLPYCPVHAPPPESTLPPTPAPPTTRAPGSTPPSAQPWVASSPSPGLDHVRVFQPLAAETATTAPVRRLDRVPSTPIPYGRSTTPPWLLDTVRTLPNRERIPLQNNLAMEQYANEGPHTPEKSRALCTGEMAAGKSGNATYPTATVPVASPSSVRRSFASTRAPGVSPLPNAFPDHSFVTLQATTAPTPIFSFASSSASSKTGATASSSASSLNSYFGESCAAPTPACDSVSVTRPSAVPSTMAYVAPQLFGEMPTPISWQGTHGTAPDYCLGHHNVILSSCASNLSEQNLDGKPQPYGFHNLNHHSVLLADGTKRSYYALPENYSLQRATSSTSPAIPTVEVSDTYQSFIPPLNDRISEKQMHPGIGIGEMMAQIQEKLKTISENLSRDLKRMESRESKQSAATQASGLAPVCCSKTHNTVGSETMFVHNLRVPITVQDYDTGLMDRQASEEVKHESEHILKCFSTAPENEQPNACLNISSTVCDFSLELQPQDDERTLKCPVFQSSDSFVNCPNPVSIEHSMRELRLLWDPGALLPLMSSTTQHYSPALQPASDATAQGRRDATAVYKVLILQLPMSANSHVWDPGVKIFLCSWLIILQEWSATDTQFPRTHITSVAAHAADVTPVLGFKANNTAGSGSRLIPMCSMKLPMNVQEASHVLKQMPVYGLYEEDTSCLNCMEKQLARRFHKASDNAFSEQLRDPQSQVLVIIERRKEWDPGATEFPFLFITSAGATESQVTDVFKPEFICSGVTPKLLNSWVNLKKMILWPCCKLQIRTPSKLSMQSLCETISLKEEKDATPMHMIMVLHLEEVTAGKDEAALYQISIIQSSMRNTTHVWNPGIASLLLVYIWLHIHKTQLVNCTSTATQSAKRNSTSPNSITSSELDFIIDRWEFLHEQGVKKNYKAKNLLSSPNYLQIKEMDIIFSTFRPP